MGLPLNERRKILERVIQPIPHAVELIVQMRGATPSRTARIGADTRMCADKTTTEEIVEALDDARKRRYEGIVVKASASPVSCAPSRATSRSDASRNQYVFNDRGRWVKLKYDHILKEVRRLPAALPEGVPDVLQGAR